MKTKKIERKLVLNKETISDLHLTAMEKAYGGVLTDTCRSICETQCPTLPCCLTQVQRTCDCY